MNQAARRVDSPQDPRLVHARALVLALEQGNQAEADIAADALFNQRDSDLFNEIGRLTRELHDALKGFSSDSRLSSIAAQDIPDARARLKYVISLTEQAASRTLGAVECIRPWCENMEQRATELQGEIQKIPRESMNGAAPTVDAVAMFLTWAAIGAQSSRAQLTEMVMAQEFQDLTGQVIRRVIELVEEVEGNLVNLIRFSASRMAPAAPASLAAPEVAANHLEGPQVPGIVSGETCQDQDDVDRLLQSLGF